MPDFLPVHPHGAITEVFPDVFMVTGSIGFGPGLAITRNMTIVRQGSELVVVNSVRLSEAGEAELAKLGNVSHVVRIGAFHDADDPYYVHKYRPTLWALPKTKHRGGIATTQELGANASPFSNAEIFVFEQGMLPEAAVVLHKDGGVLVTTDSYQNWTTFDGCSFLGKGMMRVMGFGPTHIGSPWIKQMGRAVRADFDRLRERTFRHLVPAHGTVLRDTAKEGLDQAIAGRFVS